MERFDARVVLLGGGIEDKRRADIILERCSSLPISSAVGELSLRETAALLERCQLFVGNDSAPMHLAAAGGVPVVKICGLGAHENPNSNFSPERFGPWNVPARVVRPTALEFPNLRHSPDNPALNIGAVGIPSGTKRRYRSPSS